MATALLVFAASSAHAQAVVDGAGSQGKVLSSNAAISTLLVVVVDGTVGTMSTMISTAVAAMSVLTMCALTRRIQVRLRRLFRLILKWILLKNHYNLSNASLHHLLKP